MQTTKQAQARILSSQDLRPSSWPLSPQEGEIEESQLPLKPQEAIDRRIPAEMLAGQVGVQARDQCGRLFCVGWKLLSALQILFIM